MRVPNQSKKRMMEDMLGGGENQIYRITDATLEYCRELLSSFGATEAAVRICESRGCCYSCYGIDITKRGEKGDLLFETDGLKVYIEPAVLDGFVGATLDYEDRMLIISGQGQPVYAAPLVNMRGGTRP